MLAYGEPHGDTAMAVTVNDRDHAASILLSLHAQVGIPAAIATQLLLDGRIAARGVVRPMDPAVYEPMLSLLEAEGIVMHEKRIA
jgi:alpha-aminoadipic semialdehyde synthase